jgi:hypothetical protein
MNEDGCAWYCGLKKSRGLGRRAEVHPATLMKMDAKGHAACQPAGKRNRGSFTKRMKMDARGTAA